MRYILSVLGCGLAIAAGFFAAHHLHRAEAGRKLPYGFSSADNVLFEQYFAPAVNLEPIDVALIDGAGSTIEMAAYVLTDVPVIEALTNAAARGVKVRLYRWPQEYSASAALAAALTAMRAAGVEERFKSVDAPLMHLKSYCVDRSVLRFGAANFSHSGLTEQNNDLDIQHGPEACDRFEAAFEAMWGGNAKTAPASARDAGAAESR